MKNKILPKIYRKYIPKNIQHKLDLARGQSQVFWPHFIETNSLFIHVPKAAGTSIGHAIYGRNVGHRKAIEYYKISRKNFSQLYKFSFVRNPWDRVLSAYHFAKQGGGELVKPTANMIYQSKFFETFDSFVTEWLPNIEFEKEDVIFEPQYKYICDQNKQIILDFIGKTENIENDLRIIADNLGIEINVKHLNTSRESNSYREHYTTKTRKIVEKIYLQDIDILGYSF